MSALESELGTPLFIRTTRRVDLTDAGRAFLPNARRTLAAADAARAAVGALNGLLLGRVAIGTGKTLPLAITTGLADFCETHPGIDVALRQAGSMTLFEAVADGRLDFAPLGLVDELPDYVREQVRVVELHEEPMLFACSHSHRFAKRKSVRLVDVVEDRFADLSDEWGIRIVNDRAFSDLGFPRRVAFEMNDVDDLLEIVERNLAVALVPASTRDRSERVQFVKITKPAPTWRVGVAVQRGRPPSSAALALFQALLPGVEWPA